MTKEELEKEAEDNKPPYAFCALDTKCELWKDGFQKGAEFGYNKGKTETALLSQHILDLQKDKGNLTDRVRELEQQIEKMKCCPTCDNNKEEHTPEEHYRCKTCKKFCNWELAD